MTCTAWASAATMPLGHLELDTGIAWNSDDVRFTFRTLLHSATLEGNITKAGQKQKSQGFL